MPAPDMTGSSWQIVLITSLVTLATAVGAKLLDLYVQARNRKWAAEDRRMKMEQTNALIRENTRITRETKEDVKEIRTINVEAFHAGNNVNEKIASIQLRANGIAPKGKLLLVEDYPPAATVMERVLARDGWIVSRVGTLTGALTALRSERPEQRPDVVVLDLMLPDGEGADVLRYVRERDLACRVLVVTGTHESQLAEVRALRPDALLHKPVFYDNLIDALNPLRPAVPPEVPAPAVEVSAVVVADGPIAVEPPATVIPDPKLP